MLHLNIYLKWKQACFVCFLFLMLLLFKQNNVFAQAEPSNQELVVNSDNTNDGGGDKSKLVIHGNMRDKAPNHMSNTHRVINYSAHKLAVSHHLTNKGAKATKIRHNHVTRKPGLSRINKDKSHMVSRHKAPFHHHK
jgi:hypothetical protein